MGTNPKKGIRNGRKAMLIWIKLDAFSEMTATAEEIGIPVSTLAALRLQDRGRMKKWLWNEAQA